MTAERLSLFILYTPASLFALACHEAAHGLVAHRLGDSTAKDAGRLTLNPFAHMDLLGT
ncbi:site-2 protease family protein, partial [bacterium]